MSKPPTTTDLHGPNPWTQTHKPKPQHLYGPTMLSHRRSTWSKITSTDPQCSAIANLHRARFERVDMREGERES